LLSYANQGRNARSSRASKAFSSGDAAAITRVAPASRTTEATPVEMQYWGTESADISTPAARIDSRNARALRL